MTRRPRQPEGAVVVLHGGGGRGVMMVRPTQLSVLRMIPVARRIARRAPGRLAVYRLLNSSRGWNPDRTPVDDVRWAVGQIQEDLGTDLPIGLVGHSLGGRAALLAATSPAVAATVALNPYVYPQDGQVDLAGTRVLVVHGTADRVAPMANAEAAVGLLRRHTPVTFVRVRDGKHAMLARHGAFDVLAADFVVSALLGEPVAGALTGVDPNGTVDV